MNIRQIALSLFTIAVAASFCSAAPTDSTIVEHLNSRGSVVVVQPQTLTVRMQRHAAPVETVEAETQIEDDTNAASVATHKFRAGYRIQVFDDNNVRTAKQEAQNRRLQIMSRFPDLNAYISFNSPYWRVKVGDFTTRSEAEAVMAEIRQQFPAMAQSLRIVRDRIKQQ